ncbi:MAG: GTP-binding protein [Desertimonas sp.]
MDRVALTLVAGGDVSRLLAQLAADRQFATAVVAPRDALVELPADVERIAVSPDIASRTPGCRCCEVRLDLVAAVSWLVRRREPPRRVLVAIGGDEDTVTAAHTVLSDSVLARLVRLDGVVVSIDAVQWTTRIRSGMPVDTDLGLDRLAIADRILIGRSRHVTSQALGELGHVVRSANRIAPVIAPAVKPCTTGDLLDLDAWHGAPSIGPAPAEASPFLTADHPVTVDCRAEGQLDGVRLDEWLDEVIAAHASRLLRLQGAVAVPGHTERTCFHGVRSFATSHDEAPDGGCRGDAANTVLLVGRDLPADVLLADFHATRQ